MWQCLGRAAERRKKKWEIKWGGCLVCGSWSVCSVRNEPTKEIMEGRRIKIIIIK